MPCRKSVGTILLNVRALGKDTLNHRRCLPARSTARCSTACFPSSSLIRASSTAGTKRAHLFDLPANNHDHPDPGANVGDDRERREPERLAAQQPEDSIDR